MLALHSHQPQQLEATSVRTDTLATFKEPVSIKMNAEDTAKTGSKNDLDVDQERYQRRQRIHGTDPGVRSSLKRSI